MVKRNNSKVPTWELIAFGFGGAVTGAFAKKIIPASWGDLARNGIPAGAPVAVAVLAPDMMKDPRAQAFGIGMSAYGGVGVLNTVAPKLLAGVGSVNMIAGFDRLKQIAGFDTGRAYNRMPAVGTVSAVAGGDDFMQALAEDLE